MSVVALGIAYAFGLKILRRSRERIKKKEMVRNLTWYCIRNFNILIIQAMEEKKAELQRKREEAERKARRGEMDPMHEHAIQNISQVIPQKRILYIF